MNYVVESKIIASEKLKMLREKKQDTCNHNIAIKMQEWDYLNKPHIAYCLNCRKCFKESSSIFNYKFKYIIYAEEFKRKGNFKDEEIIDFIYEKYIMLKNENPTFTDKQIIDIINSKLDMKEYKIELKNS